DNLLHFFGTVIIEARSHSKTRAQRRAYHSSACRRTDEGKFWQLQSQTARLWPLVDDNVEAIIFHRRIKILFDRGLEPMDLVNKENVAFFQTREQPRQLARFFNDRPAGIFNVRIHFARNDVGQRGFAETRWPAEQNVLENVMALFCRSHQKFQPFADLPLPRELAEHWRSQRDFEGSIGFRRFHGPVRGNLITSNQKLRTTGFVVWQSSLGSAGCQPAIVGSLSTKFYFRVAHGSRVLVSASGRNSL